MPTTPVQPISQLMAAALRHQRAGDLEAAQRLCRDILQDQPDHAAAFNLLGMIALERGDRQTAAEHICRAVALDGSVGPYHSNLGVVYRALGRVDDAVRSYRTAIALNPSYFQSHINLGNIYLDAGKLEEAGACFEHALRLRADYLEPFINLGDAYLNAGDLDRALECYERITRTDRSAPPWSVDFNPRESGRAGMDRNALGSGGTRVGSNPRYGSGGPDHTFHLARAWNNRGNVLFRQKRLDEAAHSYQRALELRPDYALAHYNLGNARNAQGNAAAAITCFQRALQLDPAYIDAHYNLGNVYLKLRRFDDAQTCYNRALALNPHYAMARYNLGNAHLERRRLSDARACYEQVLAARSDFAPAWNMLGNTFQFDERLPEAIAAYERALELRPDYVLAHVNLSSAFGRQGDMDRATAHCRRALELEPTDHLRIQWATMLPPIYSSLDDLTRWRDRFRENVAQLVRENVTLDPAVESVPHVLFLAYQGGNDRPLMEDLARLYPSSCQPQFATGMAGPTHMAASERVAGSEQSDGPVSAVPGLRKASDPATLRKALDPATLRKALDPATLGPKQAAAKIRVGFLSRYFNNHTIGYLNQGLIAKLSRERFHVIVLTPEPFDDEVGGFIRKHADRYVVVSHHIPIARERITAEQLDILFYPDIGMNGFTYSLALSRLAPVQCVTWGHPTTTGMQTIDYFVSSELLETPEAQEHYTEQLVLPKTLTTYYYRPSLPAAFKGRREFGLPEDGHLYVCPQSLFKLHPEFDPLLAGILTRDPKALIVFIEGQHSRWTQLVRERWQRTIGSDSNRIRFLPWQNRDDFLALLAACNVMLDPLHFGGGKTSYQGFAVGTPIVTLPSQFLRGRITYALYRKMDLMDCVAQSADEYVDIAVRLGTDPAYRRDIHDRILAACPVLYEDTEAVRELEQFFVQAIRGK